LRTAESEDTYTTYIISAEPQTQTYITHTQQKTDKTYRNGLLATSKPDYHCH